MIPLLPGSFSQPVGCDKVLGSGVYEDKCGVCGGNNTECYSRQGKVSQQPTYLERVSGKTNKRLAQLTTVNSHIPTHTLINIASGVLATVTLILSHQVTLRRS